MKNLARLGFVATFAVMISAASAPASPSFDQVSSVTPVQTVTVSGSAGVNL